MEKKIVMNEPPTRPMAHGTACTVPACVLEREKGVFDMKFNIVKEYITEELSRISVEHISITLSEEIRFLAEILVRYIIKKSSIQFNTQSRLLPQR